MGHSEGINHNIYQAPLAEAEILKVGSCLMAMDGTVPRVDTHCGTVTRDYVECDQITQGNRALVRNTVSIFCSRLLADKIGGYIGLKERK